MSGKSRLWVTVLIAALLAIAACTVAGPYVTIRAIGHAVRTNDADALRRQVDFAALRVSFKAQIADRIVRRAGADAATNPFGAVGIAIASGLAGGAVDAMVTPAGIAAIMEGRKIRDRASGVPLPGSDDVEALHDSALFDDAICQFESASRFTATIRDDQNRPIVFVLIRHGVVWKLSDVRLPL